MTTSTLIIHFQSQKLKKRMKCPRADPAPDSGSTTEALYCPGLLAQRKLFFSDELKQRCFAHLWQKHKNFFTSLQSPTHINRYHKDKNRLLLNAIIWPSTPLSCQPQLLKHCPAQASLLASVDFPYLCKRDSRKGRRSSLRLPPHNSPTPGTRRSTAATFKDRKLIEVLPQSHKVISRRS